MSKKLLEQGEEYMKMESQEAAKGAGFPRRSVCKMFSVSGRTPI